MPDDSDLQAPANLGAPAPSTLSPRISRNLMRRSVGHESGRMVLLSIAGGIGVIVVLAVVGSLIRG